MSFTHWSSAARSSLSLSAWAGSAARLLTSCGSASVSYSSSFGLVGAKKSFCGPVSFPSARSFRQTLIVGISSMYRMCWAYGSSG